MNPEREQARTALDEVIRAHPDTFGPACWCDDGDCDGDCENPVPATVGLTGWILVAEWDDLDPDGSTSTRWQTSPGTNANKALGLLTRAARRL